MKSPINPIFSVFKELLNAKDTPFDQSLLDIYKRIKEGNKVLINKIELIRKSNDKEVKDSIKKQLYCICFNGTFSQRSKNGLVEHSGLCVLDFDDFENEEQLQTMLKKIKETPFIVMAFRSPSGDGIKAVARIPKSTAEEHERRFESLENYFSTPYFDKKNRDVSRVCFESYDPEIYLNQFCEEFSEIEKEKGYTYTERVPVCILQDEQKKIDIILGFKWDKSFVEGQRNAYIFDIAGAFCEYGISQFTAENYILNNIVKDSFSEKETLTAIRSAYKKRAFDSKYFEDYHTVKIVERKIAQGVSQAEIIKSHNVDPVVIAEIIEKNNANCDIFWEVQKTKQGEKISIEPYKYASFLVKNGFMKYYPETAKIPNFVRVKENKVNISSADVIKDFVMGYLNSTGNINIWNYCAKNPIMFNANYLNMIDSIYLKTLQDKIHESFIPYQNGVVLVTKNKVELLSYIDIDGYIWEEQIIKRDFVKITDYKNDFQDFVSKICNNDPERIIGLETTIGYLLHSYKDKTDQKAVIFNDQEIDDNPNGGSGKSLMLNAISYIRKMVKIDGKSFDPKKSDFVYQRVKLDTQILAFDDVKKYFNFIQLFSIVTEGIPVNRKNQDEIYIPFERSPKIAITTNYVINGDGGSHDRRRHEIEVFQYFNSKRTPIKEYGRLLFDSWNALDWQKFDNYMIYCLQLFLNKGLVKNKIINAEKKRLIQTTNTEFYSFAVEDDYLPSNVRIYNTEIIMKFANEYKQYRDVNTKTFLKWVSEYATFKGFDFIKNRDTSGRYFELKETETETKMEKDCPF
jgi:hypothetical protein